MSTGPKMKAFGAMLSAALLVLLAACTSLPGVTVSRTQDGSAPPVAVSVT